MLPGWISPSLVDLHSQGNPPYRCHTHKGVNLMQPILDFGLSSMRKSQSLTDTHG